ncbi:sulfotransferase 1C2A-like isoform 1-T1 [Anomaloglossus baeobatrachus]
MDPQVIQKVVHEMANFTPKMSDIEGVPLIKGIWDTIYNFQARDGDIVVVSYPKSGTTWMQEILDLIVQESLIFAVTWGSWFDHVLGWWQAKDKYKVLYVFYEDMIEDSRREIKKVMRFLGKNFSEDIIQKILFHTSFKSMKDNPMVNFSAIPETVLDQSVSSFMRKGTVGDWKNHFVESQNMIFDEEDGGQRSGLP